MGGKGSGGAHGGPQYNPNNINPMGGDGQSGQKLPNYTGFAYGENTALNNQASGAKMAQADVATGRGAHNIPDLQGLLAGITPIDAPPSDPTLPVSHGVDVGRGGGSEVLPAAYRNDQRNIENVDLIKKYLPDLIIAARANGAPDSYKQFVNYLKSQVI